MHKLVYHLRFVAMSAIHNLTSCWQYFGGGSKEAKEMEQELLVSGVHAVPRASECITMYVWDGNLIMAATAVGITLYQVPDLHFAVAGVLDTMQQSWRQLAADMEQQ
jgi:hypothetical protein